MNIFEKFNETFIASGYYTLMLEGLKNTVIITLGALIIGVIIGTFISVVKYSSEEVRWLKPFAFIGDLYVTVIRGIPMTVLLLLFYYIILKSADGILVAIICFGVNSGAYMAELIRSGINAVDCGQMEAARSLGLSRLLAMRHVVLPQAVKNILPAIGNELIALLKETSVAGYVAVVDLTRAGNLVRNNTYDAVSTLVLVALIYLAMVVGLTRLIESLEKYLAKGTKRKA